ncbi:MAG: putative S-adenosyl-L-methionine-dependent methyltransferase, partial [Streblomastix strix]
SQDPILLPTGCLVANDVSKKRCYVLAKQLAQQQSPVLLITNHDATRFPFIADETEIFSQSQLLPKQQKGIFLFDRILCDVPCSGTGTLRKQKKIEHTFSPFDQLILHPIQMSILNRSIQLLREGGIVVYSTCSLCPLEDEAVVSAILLRWGKKVEIVDVQNHDEIVGYEQEQQQEERIQINEENKEDLYNNINETENGVQKQKKNNKMKNKNKNKEKVKKVLPLLKTEIGLSDWKDTGGFFIAVIRKRHQYEYEKEKDINMEQKENENENKEYFGMKQEKEKEIEQQKEIEVGDENQQIKVKKKKEKKQKLDFLYLKLLLIQNTQLQQKYGTPISFALSGVVTTQHALFLAGPQDLFDTLIPLIELVCITSEQNINVQEKKIRKTKK